MKLAVLFSGGKDSTYALHLAKQYEEVVCLISLVSKNPDSFMFHTPNIEWTVLQAKKLSIPIILQETEGEEEAEIHDLKTAVTQAMTKFGVQGVVTGAIGSIYQASRVQRICNELSIECFNPLWQKSQEELLHELVDLGFDVRIVGIAADQLNEEWLGKKLDRHLIARLVLLKDSIGFNPAGEGGEYETFVTNSPDFSSAIIIRDAKKICNDHVGKLVILEAE